MHDKSASGIWQLRDFRRRFCLHGKTFVFKAKPDVFNVFAGIHQY